MQDLHRTFKALGLLESEVKTYLSALEHGASSVIDLSKRTGLSRPATYSAIESLTERGLFSSVLRGKKRVYAAEHPSKLIAYARRREGEIHEHIKDLERSVQELELMQGGERPTVKLFEGKEGAHTVITDQVETKARIVDEIADLDSLYATLSLEDLNPLREKLRAAGTKVRGLYSGKPSETAVSVDRYALPKEYGQFKSNISVYGNKIALVTFEGKMHSIIIESSALAKTLRILFDLAFKKARENIEKK